MTDTAAERTGHEAREAQLRALYASSVIGFMLVDEGRVLDANDAFLAMVGYSREELEGGALSWREMTPAEYRDADAVALEELATRGACTPFQKEYFRKDGSRVPILLAATQLRDEPLQWACCAINLSRPDQEMRVDRILGTIIERVPVGIIVVDERGRLVLMNEAGRAISGGQPVEDTTVADQADAYSLREPLTGRPLGPEETPIGRALAGEVVERFEYVFRPTGASADRWVRVDAVPLEGSRGRSRGALAVFEDVTAEREGERGREAFLSTLAHDLKSPLTSIKGFSQLLERSLDRKGALQPDEARPHLRRITHMADRLSSLINELLDAARLQSGEVLELNRSVTDLVELVRHVAEQADVEDGHVVIVESTETSLVGRWDAPRLERVLMNLVSNATTYSPDQPEVRIRVATEERDGDRWALVAVQDRGIGIPKSDLSRVFDRFYRGGNVVDRFGGTGIGLFGVKQIVEQHAGRVTVESQVGLGSTFTVWLPLSGSD